MRVTCYNITHLERSLEGPRENHHRTSRSVRLRKLDLALDVLPVSVPAVDIE